MYILMNAIGFQMAWWACISSVSRDLEREAIAFCFILASLHVYASKTLMQEIKVGVFAVLTGIWVDSWLQHFSVINFYGWALGALSPFWLWTLWAMLGLTLNASLAFLKEQSPITTAFIGLVFGPLTYYAGAKLGAAEFDASITHMASLAIVWALVMPLLVFTARQKILTSKDYT
jgi:hypothetical protein